MTRGTTATLGPLAALLALLPTVPAAPGGPVDFRRDIQPILEANCYKCHGPAERRAGLRLTSRKDAFSPTDSNTVVIDPGHSSRSALIQRVTATDPEQRMPKKDAALATAQIELLKRWIDEGADWPAAAGDKGHWAYVKPIQAPLPPVKNQAWPRNAIDYFILARLEREGLQPAPEADRARLLRRVYLDLIGLPPSPEQADAFLQDQDPGAYEKVVDHLLALPQYGERWARPWLDLARYADSHGFQRDDLRDAWPYRDWVIQALNADLPFDQFTIEQIAGDLLPHATAAQQIATGFHRCAPCNVEAGTDQEENRVNQIFDRVNTTAAVWLGTTMECAQCHNHKYDPFTMKDYYGLFACFNNTAQETDFLSPKARASLKFIGPYLQVPDPANSPARRELEQRIAAVEQQITGRSAKLQAGRTQWEEQLKASLAGVAETHVLEIADFDSLGESNHKILDDHSVLLVDDPPDKDTYIATVRTKLTGLTGFKLEALTDPSLPGTGPGRGDAKRPNFVLNNFKVSAAPASTPGRTEPVTFIKATASFSQGNFPVSNLLKPDNDSRGGWAINPEFHKPHWAVFETEKPVGFDGGTVITFRLEQNYGAGRVIGRLRLSAFTGNLGAKALPADVAANLKIPNPKRTAEQSNRLADYQLAEDKALGQMKLSQAKLERELAGLRGPRTLVMQEMPQARPAAIFKRGSFLDRGEPVKPGTPAALNPAPDGPVNRLTLARWLVSQDNPLTARVTVNRWWAEFFGHGIVTTPEDFGVKGEPPTHPELLDWLAVEFMEPACRAESLKTGGPRGWSMKHIHRLIVTSATYRQSAKLAPELLARDDQNKLYARGPRFRLDAETVRDNALAAAGLLQLKQGGPPVYPYQPPGLWESKVGGDKVSYEVSQGEDAHRRGIYVVWKRASPYPSFINFDAPARTACVIKRSRSNTPLQALTLLNDPVYVEAARALARRALAEKPAASVEERIAHLFRLCLVRNPKATELSVLKQFYEAQLSSSRANATSIRASAGRSTAPNGGSVAEFAAWEAVASAVLNLDEMITKG